MNHRQKEITNNLDLIQDARKGIESCKKQIESEKIRIATFRKYIESRISSNKQLRKHEMYDDQSRIYCLECGYVKGEEKIEH